MRILLVAAASSVHVMRWANAFVERGHQVHLASLHDPIPGFRSEVVLHRIPYLFGAGYFLCRAVLRRLVRSVRPEIMNAHYASGYGTLAVREKGAPLVLNVWGSDVYEFPDSGPVQRWLLRRNLRRADAVVSTSEVMARRTQEVCPGLGPITVVPFGVDVGRFAPAHQAAAGPFTIGTVKTLAPKYGIDTLIRAFAVLAERTRGNMRLRIVGGGAQEMELKKLIGDQGLADRVEMVGPVAHALVPEELKKLHVYVALSRTHSESFGVAIIEASACGLPVVVADVGGLPEVVEHGVTGWVVPPDDPNAAAERLMELCASADLRERMGSAGRQHVIDKYAWEACVDRQLAVFQRVLANRP